MKRFDFLQEKTKRGKLQSRQEEFNFFLCVCVFVLLVHFFILPNEDLTRVSPYCINIFRLRFFLLLLSLLLSLLLLLLLKMGEDVFVKNYDIDILEN